MVKYSYSSLLRMVTFTSTFYSRLYNSNIHHSPAPIDSWDMLGSLQRSFPAQVVEHQHVEIESKIAEAPVRLSGEALGKRCTLLGSVSGYGSGLILSINNRG